MTRQAARAGSSRRDFQGSGFSSAVDRSLRQGRQYPDRRRIVPDEGRNMVNGIQQPSETKNKDDGSVSWCLRWIPGHGISLLTPVKSCLRQVRALCSFIGLSTSSFSHHDGVNSGKGGGVGELDVSETQVLPAVGTVRNISYSFTQSLAATQARFLRRPTAPRPAVSSLLVTLTL